MPRYSVGPWGRVSLMDEFDPQDPAARPYLYAHRGPLDDPADTADASGKPGSSRWVYSEAPTEGPALELLDEATALCAGHRPCETNDPSRYATFSAAYAAAHRLPGPPEPDAIDARLEHERLDESGSKPAHDMSWVEVPDGTIVEFDWSACLVYGEFLHQWSPQGYTQRRLRPRHGTARVLTPPSLVAVLATGYIPLVHASADSRGDRPGPSLATTGVAQGAESPHRPPVLPDIWANEALGGVRVRFHTTGTRWWKDEDHSMTGVHYGSLHEALFGELGLQRFLRWTGMFPRMSSLSPRPVHGVVWQEGTLADVLVGGVVGDRQFVALVPRELAVPGLRLVDLAPGRAGIVSGWFVAYPKIELEETLFQQAAVEVIAHQTEPSGPGPEAGWYPDPLGHSDARWWDGRAWTSHVRTLTSPGRPERIA